MEVRRFALRERVIALWHYLHKLEQADIRGAAPDPFRLRRIPNSNRFVKANPERPRYAFISITSLLGFV
jgi:hypothetical protein